MRLTFDNPCPYDTGETMLRAHDVWVQNAAIRVTGPDGDAAVTALRAAEAAIRAAVLRVSDSLGDEVVLLRCVRFDLRATTTDGAIPLPDLEQHFYRGLRRAAEQACSGATSGAVSEHVAWFVSEGNAAGQYACAVAGGYAADWPFSALVRLGSTCADVFSTYLSGGQATLGDILAAVAASDQRVAVVNALPSAMIQAINQRWFAVDGGQVEADWLPPNVVDEFRRRMADLLPEFGEERSCLLALSYLLAAWPPARALQLPSIAVQRGPARGVPSSEVRSAAGGLVAWQALLDESGIEDSLWAGYSDARGRGAARLAVGLALENPSDSNIDPLLKLWMGESRTATVSMLDTFSRVSAEPLHAAALRVACEKGWLHGELSAFPLGDQTAVMGAAGLCVDTVNVASAHDAVAPAVAVYMRRTGRQPRELTALVRGEDIDIDAIREVDVCCLPEPWRIAARAAASVIRCALQTLWKLPVGTLRRWPASIDGTASAPRVRIEPRHARTVQPIDRAQFEVRLGGVRCMVLVAS